LDSSAVGIVHEVGESNSYSGLRGSDALFTNDFGRTVCWSIHWFV